MLKTCFQVALWLNFQISLSPLSRCTIPAEVHEIHRRDAILFTIDMRTQPEFCDVHLASHVILTADRISLTVQMADVNTGVTNSRSSKPY